MLANDPGSALPRQTADQFVNLWLIVNRLEIWLINLILGGI